MSTSTNTSSKRISSDRDARAARRNRVREQQAVSRSISTASINAGNKEDVSESVHVISDYKTRNHGLNPAPNVHSANSEFFLESHLKQSSSVHEHVDDVAHSNIYAHRARDSNISDFELNAKTPINFPPAGEKSSWAKTDNKLDILLPEAFPLSKISSSSITNLSIEIDNFLYDFFFKEFGPKPSLPLCPGQ